MTSKHPSAWSVPPNICVFSLSLPPPESGVRSLQVIAMHLGNSSEPTARSHMLSEPDKWPDEGTKSFSRAILECLWASLQFF